MEQLIITLESPLAKGDDYLVEIKFAGILTNEIVGFYRSSYMDEDGNKR